MGATAPSKLVSIIYELEVEFFWNSTAIKCDEENT